MKKINFKNGETGRTPLNATNLNLLQDNVEEEILSTQKDIENEILTTEKTTEVAETLTITDCAGVNGKLDIKSGKSEQKTRSGYNKLNLDNLTDMNIFGATLTKNSDGSFTLNGTPTNSQGFTIALNNPEILKANKSYTLKVKTTGTATSTSGSLIAIREEENTNLTNVNFSGTSKVYTPTKDENVNYVRIYIDKEVTFTNFTVYPLLYEGTDNKEFEQYGVSPSPDYPSDIRNVGDNIQLFDKTTTTDGKYVGSDGSVQTQSTAMMSDYIKVETNIDFYISGRTTWASIGLYDENKTFLERIATTNPNGVLNITNSNCKYIILNASLIDKDTLKLEKGTKATSPSEYGCGSVGFRVKNKNKFDGKLELGNITSAGVNTSSNNCVRCIDYIPVKPNTEYIMQNDKNYQCLIYEYDENKNLVVYLGDKRTPFTTRETTKYIRFRSGVTNVENDLSVKYQLEEGNVATDYVEHQEQTVVFPLSQGQLLHKGDYLAEDGIHQVRKTLVLNGTENWNARTDNRFDIELLDLKDGVSNSICTHYMSIESWVLHTETNNTHIVNKETGWSLGRISIKDTKFSTVEQFKTYLAQQYANGTPVIVEYELAEETITPYTEEQEEAYYQLQHLLMYEGYTSIECIDEIKPDIQATYLYNNAINNTYAKRLDEVETNKVSNLNDNTIAVNFSEKGKATITRKGQVVTVFAEIEVGPEEVHTLANYAELPDWAIPSKLLNPTNVNKSIRSSIFTDMNLYAAGYIMIRTTLKQIHFVCNNKNTENTATLYTTFCYVVD